MRATTTAEVWEFVWPDASGNGNDAVQSLRPADVATIIAERDQLIARARELEQRVKSDRVADALERIAAKLDLALIQPDLRCERCSGTGRVTIEDDDVIGRIHGIVACRACSGTGGKLLDPDKLTAMAIAYGEWTTDSVSTEFFEWYEERNADGTYTRQAGELEEKIRSARRLKGGR